MNITFKSRGLPEKDVAVIFATKDARFTASAKDLDKALDGALSRAVKTSRFDGGRGETLHLLAPGKSDLTRVLLVGLGQPADLDGPGAESLGGTIAAELLTSGETKATILLDDIKKPGISVEECAARIGVGLRLRAWRFDKYRTKEDKKKKPSLERVVLSTDRHAKAEEFFTEHDKVLDGVFFTRNLTSEPANVLHPESFAEELMKLEADGLEVEVLGENDMEKLGMEALLGVGRGSERESKMVIMRWAGAKDKKTKPIALVGKGVTFDTGGISIKPADGMWDMKWDMGGAGIVAGAMKALARRKAKVNVVGLVGLVENMPDGRAQRPGDVVKSLSGQTIEVLNTDAEGRLVLADVLWYAQDKYQPKLMVDFATLTGAIIVSLGQNQYAGLFSDNDTLADQLLSAGRSSGDGVWRMPLSEDYDKLIDSDIADVKNLGGKWAGSITAAQFLKRFTNDVPWAHLDVAGMVWSDKATKLWDKGATGYGVRLVDRFIAENHEDRG